MDGMRSGASLLYRALRMVPTPLQKLLIYLGSPKLTLGASAIIADTDGRVLLVRHTYRRPAWGFPSGLVGHREQPAIALARELREELGVPASVERLLYAETAIAYHHLTLYYRVRIQGTPCPSAPEIDAYRFVSIEEITHLTGLPVPSWLRKIRWDENETAQPDPAA